MKFGIPNKLSRRGPCEISNILSLKYPTLLARAPLLFILSRLFRSDNEQRLLCCFSLFKSSFPLFGQYLIGILEFTRGGNNVIIWNDNFHFVISEFKGELTTPHKLLVMPSIHIGIGNHPREPLSDFINSIAIFFKKLVSTARTNLFRIYNVIIPI